MLHDVDFTRFCEHALMSVLRIHAAYDWMPGMHEFENVHALPMTGCQVCMNLRMHACCVCPDVDLRMCTAYIQVSHMQELGLLTTFLLYPSTEMRS